MDSNRRSMLFALVSFVVGLFVPWKRVEADKKWESPSVHNWPGKPAKRSMFYFNPPLGVSMPPYPKYKFLAASDKAYAEIMALALATPSSLDGPDAVFGGLMHGATNGIVSYSQDVRQVTYGDVHYFVPFDRYRLRIGDHTDQVFEGNDAICEYLCTHRHCSPEHGLAYEQLVLIGGTSKA